MRVWMAVASAKMPICPPSASISRTRLPLERPPMAGLQDILAIVSGFCVMSTVLVPSLARARAASTPACPPPMTIASKSPIPISPNRLIVRAISHFCPFAILNLHFEVLPCAILRQGFIGYLVQARTLCSRIGAHCARLLLSLSIPLLRLARLVHLPRQKLLNICSSTSSEAMSPEISPMDSAAS